MRFVALDVETANADLASICQIGLAVFDGGLIADSWSTLLNPEDDFDSINVDVHGIDERAVDGSPLLPDVAERVRGYLEGAVVACHTAFDRGAVTKAFRKYGLDPVACTWLDTARVARRAWPDKFASSGYGLANVAQFLGIKFKHHDAAEDARAAGEVLCRACEQAGLTVRDWIARVALPIDPSMVGLIERAGCVEWPFYGHTLAFTGELALPRREAADLASKAGCNVSSGVTKKTTLLVVGDQDLSKLAGHEKSLKHRKAEELIANGAPIRILSESDFQNLVNLTMV